MTEDDYYVARSSASIYEFAQKCSHRRMTLICFQSTTSLEEYKEEIARVTDWLKYALEANEVRHIRRSIREASQ